MPQCCASCKWFASYEVTDGPLLGFGRCEWPKPLLWPASILKFGPPSLVTATMSGNEGVNCQTYQKEPDYATEEERCK